MTELDVRARARVMLAWCGALVKTYRLKQPLHYRGNGDRGVVLTSRKIVWPDRLFCRVFIGTHTPMRCVFYVAGSAAYPPSSDPTWMNPPSPPPATE